MVFSEPLCTTDSLTVASGAIAPIFLARSRASFTSLPLTAVMTSPASMPALAAGLSGLRLRDQRALRLLQAEAVGDVLRHRLDLHADPAARHRAVILELATTLLTVSAGIAKAMPTEPPDGE